MSMWQEKVYLLLRVLTDSHHTWDHTTWANAMVQRHTGLSCSPVSRHWQPSVAGDR